MNSDDQYRKIFESFYKLMVTRFAKKKCTTEDSVRYTFFFAVTKILDCIEPEHFIMEYPLNGIRLDTVIEYPEYPMALEFKYFRELPGNHNRDRTSAAGSVFCDIFRLNRFNHKKHSLRKFFVLLTDNEMHNYFSRNTNGLSDFYNLDVDGKKFTINASYLEGRSMTLKNAAGCGSEDGIGEAHVVCRFSKNLPNNHNMRVYEIF